MTKTYAIVLAAGKGTRFGESDVNKTAATFNGTPIIRLGIEKIKGDFDKVLVVVGNKKESVFKALDGIDVTFIEQVEQKGTGDAVRTALDYLNKEHDIPDNVFVTNGDHLFMIDHDAISQLSATHCKNGNDVTVLTTIHDRPEDLTNGRIVRNDNRIIRIIEKSELAESEKEIKELNTGTYMFKFGYIEHFFRKLEKVPTEIYITNACVKTTARVGSFTVPYEKVGSGINTRDELKAHLNRNIPFKYDKKSARHKLVELFVVISLLIIVLGKLLLSDPGGTVFLVAYGVTVTFVLWMNFLVAFHFYRDPYKLALKEEKKNGSNNEKYMVSCMVAVKNEQDNIGRCIDSMLKQTYENREIIVVNDASTDNTLNILKEYEADGKIKLINLETNMGKKRALGHAMLVAKGNIFAHTDSDSVWAPDALEKIEKVFEYFPDVGAVSGHGRAINGDQNLLTKIQDSWMEGQFSVRKSFESAFGAVTCVSGPLAVFRREAVYNFIPAWMFDTFLGQEFKFATDRTMTGFVLGSKVMGEKLKKKYQDSDFVKSVNYPTKDWQVVYCKSAKSWTIVPDTFKKMIRQQIRWKKSFIRNLFFTGSFYWRRPLPAAFVYYTHILFVLVGPLIVFRHLIYLPLQGNIFSAILYLSGIVFIGFMLGFAYKLENKHCHKWIYRPAMSLLSTLVLSWLVFYSALTIKKMVWHR